MTRPLSCLPRPAAVLVLIGLAACSEGRDPAISAVAVPPPRGAAAPAVPTGPGQIYRAPAPGQAVRDQAAVAAACRGDADRIIVTRDRGQLMREDEAASRVGSQASIYSQRAETDRLGRIFERDRIASDCVQENTRGAPR